MVRMEEEKIYRKLGQKINNLTVKAPWNEILYTILKELYAPEEAELLVKMPYTFSTLDRIARTTGLEKIRVRTILEKLCNKGLVIDVWNEQNNQYHYMPSPLLIGIFEFTMMRTNGSPDKKEYARLFHEYLASFYKANFSQEEQTSILRVIPVEETIRPTESIEFLDYEKVTSIIEDSHRFGIGLCSCRNEKFHNGEKECDVPIENCSTFGYGADYTIRYHFAREVSKSEMVENFARSKELGLVFCVENTKRNPTVICHCCKCCCNYLAGLSKLGYLNSVVTSNYISKIDEELCKGCGKCVDLCPVNALSLVSANDPKHPKKKKARLDTEVCVGCGVCAAKCPTKTIDMVHRGKRIIHPETAFERIMLLSLERGNLQNQIFDNPQSITQEFMRTFIGGFLRLSPVKRALMSDLFRSSFLNFMKMGAKMQGKGWITEL
jgi:Pyruvate/2-oxoacid:ferredoxin oxidoreductase delta subunit